MNKKYVLRENGVVSVLGETHLNKVKEKKIFKFKKILKFKNIKF